MFNWCLWETVQEGLRTQGAVGWKGRPGTGSMAGERRVTMKSALFSRLMCINKHDRRVLGTCISCRSLPVPTFHLDELQIHETGLTMKTPGRSQVRADDWPACVRGWDLAKECTATFKLYLQPHTGSCDWSAGDLTCGVMGIWSSAAMVSDLGSVEERLEEQLIYRRRGGGGGAHGSNHLAQYAGRPANTRQLSTAHILTLALSHTHTHTHTNTHTHTQCILTQAFFVYICFFIF